MGKLIEILLGLIFLIVPIYAWIVDIGGFGDAALTFLKGGIVWLLLLIGAVLLLLGISELKN